MLSAPFRVVLDACVLYPMHLRDVLLQAAAEGLYQAYCSKQILDEATRNLVAKLQITESQAAHLITTMSGAFPESIVTDYEHLVAAMRIDPKDRHVAAAAVKVGAQVVVTDNISASTGSRSRARVQSRDAREGYMLRVKQLECLGVGGARVSRLRAGVDRDRTLRRSHQSRSAQ